MTFEFSQQIFKRYSNIKSWESVQGESSCFLQTDRQTDMTKIIFAFSNFANGPKNKHKSRLLNDMQDLRLSQWFCWGFYSSGMWYVKFSRLLAAKMCAHVCVCVCVCVCIREKQLVAYVLLVDNISISAVKMSLQNGKMGVKRRGKSKLLMMCLNSWILNLRWLSQFLLQKCRRVMEAICASRTILCRIMKEVWKVVSQWHFQFHVNWDQKCAIKRLR